MTTKPKHYSLRFSDTQLLLIGLLIGYVGFVLWLGMRLIVLLSGAVIVVLAIASSYVQLKRPKTNSLVTSANLLEKDVFLSHIKCLDNQIPDVSQPLWRSVQQQAEAIQEIATQIAEQESTFTPDLLETLHTVLDLVEQIIPVLQITPQLRMSSYREFAQQKLESSRQRLQQTHKQLQELHDQFALENLKKRSFTTSDVISARLQILIAENERGILGD
ncbi:MAG: hypothetical protein RM338_11605 [Nostoc sp. DedQUE12a]|nr:hypothetical protein [Nostoc sp. DedQUE12a]